MTRSTLSPVRRFVAPHALAGVAGLGGVAVAPAASAAPADDPAVAHEHEAKPLDVTLPNVTRELMAARRCRPCWLPRPVRR
jgi:hypothetical protein